MWTARVGERRVDMIVTAPSGYDRPGLERRERHVGAFRLIRRRSRSLRASVDQIFKIKIEGRACHGF